MKESPTSKRGRAEVHAVLKDPFGNSTIISEKAKKRRIGRRELKGLKFGEQATAARNVQ
jgi:C4-type Zn-finger protein